MKQIAAVRAAFRNMVRSVVRDPTWALVSLIVIPFRASHYVVISFSVVFGMEYLMKSVGGVREGNALWYFGKAGITALMLLVAFRMLTDRLVKHFGDEDDVSS